jgi:hypothetical protein
MNLPSVPVDNRNGLAGVIHKHLLPGSVFLAHDQIQLSDPFLVLFAKPTVLIPIGMGFLVFLPEEEKGNAFFLEFFPDLCPVRHGTRGA